MKNPPSSPLCLSAQTNYKKLETLAKEFNIAFDRMVASGKQEDLKETERLKKEIEDISQWFEKNCSMGASFEKAKQIMGEEKVFGAKDIGESLNITLSQENLPPIPFSPEELEKAKKRGEILIYIPDKAGNTPITAKWIQDSLQNQTKPGSGEQKKIFWQTGNYEREAFFLTESPTPGWRLIPENSFILKGDQENQTYPATHSNYAEQTDTMAKYIEEALYPDVNKRPRNVKEALEEWNKEKTKLLQDAQSQDESIWKPTAQKLSKLKINKLFRNSFIEEILCLLIANNKNINTMGQAKNKNNDTYWQYRWTNSSLSSGRLVGVGCSGADGVRVRGGEPRRRDDDLASAFSRNEFLKSGV
jgi:hypothetical protein